MSPQVTEEGVGVDKKSKTSGKEKEKNKKTGRAAANKKQKVKTVVVANRAQYDHPRPFMTISPPGRFTSQGKTGQEKATGSSSTER